MSHTITSRKVLATAITACLMYTAPSFATSSGGSQELEGYVSEADFIFRGVVEDVKYRLSDPSPKGGAPLPFTYVTYRVNTAMKGSPADKRITLRFIGGLDEQKGLFMGTDQTPLFDVGDEDILFAKQDAGTLGPLVRNAEGRFRVIGEQIYTNDGQEVTLGPKNTVRVGKRHAFEEVLSNSVKGHVMRTQSSTKAEPAGTLTKAIDSDAFAQAITDSVAQKPTGPIYAFRGSDPGEPLAAPDVAPEAPPAAP